MRFFHLIRSWFTPYVTPFAPKYGRGIHALPNPQEKELFENASEAFMQGNILDGYEYFLTSLIHQEIAFPTAHLKIERIDQSLRFELFQGCARVKGIVTEHSFEAYADIAYANTLHVAIKRRFLERNFQLTYAKFSSREGIVTLSIHLDNATITPQKIFYPLREIALNADFEKEFIASEFQESPLLEANHLQKIDDARAQRLHSFMNEWIRQTKTSLTGLLANDNTGMVSFSYLTLLLQIDYLLTPHKKMAKDINEKINGYFMDDEKSTEDKNADLEQYLSELESMDSSTFISQMYDSAYTFSPYEQAMHDEIASFIDESLNKIRWYKNNRSTYVVSVIYRYISLYILYNYGLHPSLRTLLHLHVEVYMGDFFEAEGEIRLYANGIFQKNKIRDRIDSAIEPYIERYQGLKNFADELNYTDLNHFSQSFYLQLKNLDYSEA